MCWSMVRRIGEKTDLHLLYGIFKRPRHEPAAERAGIKFDGLFHVRNGHTHMMECKTVWHRRCFLRIQRFVQARSRRSKKKPKSRRRRQSDNPLEIRRESEARLPKIPVHATINPIKSALKMLRHKRSPHSMMRGQWVSSVVGCL